MKFQIKNAGNSPRTSTLCIIHKRLTRPYSIRHILIFADDIKIFRSIINMNDQDILQQDITTIEKWNHDWMLTLHPDKCTHMEIGKKIM